MLDVLRTGGRVVLKGVVLLVVVLLVVVLVVVSAVMKERSDWKLFL